MACKGILLLGICAVLCHVALSGCVEDLQKDQQAMDCMMGYASYFGQSSSDGTSMFDMVCSEEGQAAMVCVVDFMNQCPELTKSQGLSGMPSKEQIAQMCGQVKGLGGFSKTCMDAQACLVPVQSESAFPTGFAMPRTKFTYVQQLMDPICGSFAEVFKCITPEVENECPLLVESVRNISAMAQTSMPPDVNFPSYDTLKKLAMESCPKLPQDFGTSRCVRDYLRDQSYVECIIRVNKNYTTAEEKASCDAVDDRLACLSDILVDNCGKDYYDGIVNHAHYFFTDQPLRCDTGSAAFAQLSAMTSLISLLLVLIA